jgi:hypothetical protein
MGRRRMRSKIHILNDLDCYFKKIKGRAQSAREYFP